MRILSLVVALLIASVASATEVQEAQKDATSVVASKEEAKEAVKVFKDELKKGRRARSFNDQAEAVKKVALFVHADVAKELTAVALQSPFGGDDEPAERVALRVEAIRSLALQTSSKDYVCKKLAQAVGERKFPEAAAAEAVKALAILDYENYWLKIASFIPLSRLEVAAAALNIVGERKDLRVHTQVDALWSRITGAAGASHAISSSASAARELAKKESGKPNRIGTKELGAVLSATTSELTGLWEKDAIRNVDGFRKWVGEHKNEIKAAEARRD